jgi:hypothetical protein
MAVAKWYHETKSNRIDGSSQKIEFYEIMYQSLLLRMNRLSQLYPEPSPDMRRKAINAAVNITKEYSQNYRIGKFFYYFAAAHRLVETGVTLLESILSAFLSLDEDNYLIGYDIAVLTTAINAIPQLLRAVSQRWPDILHEAVAIEEAAVPVLEKLDQWSRGQVPMITLPDRLLRIRLTKFLISPMLSAEDSRTRTNNEEENELCEGQNTHYPADTGLERSLGCSDTLHQGTLNLQPDFGEQYGTTWPGSPAGQQFVDWNSETFPGTSASNPYEEMDWDILAGLGMDEIFAALDDGRYLRPPS